MTSFFESTTRSAIKSLLWRLVAGSVTMGTCLRWGGTLSQALALVGSDFGSKSLTMFLGERLMNQSSAGRTSAGSDHVGRSLAKTLIWRLFAICNTLVMALFIAKDLSLASKIAGSDALIKTGMMFAYERLWAKIAWGKEYCENDNESSGTRSLSLSQEESKSTTQPSRLGVDAMR